MCVMGLMLTCHNIHLRGVGLEEELGAYAGLSFHEVMNVKSSKSLTIWAFPESPQSQLGLLEQLT
jgi:hypothetical protein